MSWPGWLVAAITVLSGLVPAAASAVTLTVTMPDTVTVGQTGLTAHVTLTNADPSSATICNQGECPGPSEGIIVIPSCASAATPAPTCSVPDPAVFAFAPSAPILASSCGALVTSFDVVVADVAQGKLRLVPVGGPNPHVVLAPGGILPTVCDIPLTFSVTAAPALDAVVDTPGVQTFSSASADVQGKAGAAKQTATGRDVTTVAPGAATAPPPPPPPSPAVPPPPPPPVTQPSDLDHFTCYEALQSGFRRRSVLLRDQFGQRRTRVVRTRQLCNPVSKNGARILQPRAHLVCYETARTAFAARTVVVTNQFGRRRLRVTRPNRLCVPSLKRKSAGPLPSRPNPARLLDHFRCYDVAPQAAAQTVRLADQFGATSTKVLRVIGLCNPVRKNNEPVRRAKSHLVCYSIQDGETFRPIGVRVRNQFGRATLRVRRPQSLCLPSFKEVVQTTAPAAAPRGLDHFKCYIAEQRQFEPRLVGLEDQFGQAEAKIVTVRQLCDPVSKNAGKVLNRTAHLVCYETQDLGVDSFKPRDVSVSNQFGIRPLTAIRPSALCLPSLKRESAGAPTGSNPERVLDHFRCYDVKPQPAGRTVKLVDQFATTKTKTLRVVRLCNPVSKNAGVLRRPRAHLVCYSIVERTFRPLAVTVRNQFGVAALRVLKPETLCLPSFKREVDAAGAAIALSGASP